MPLFHLTLLLDDGIAHLDDCRTLLHLLQALAEPTTLTIAAINADQQLFGLRAPLDSLTTADLADLPLGTAPFDRALTAVLNAGELSAAAPTVLLVLGPTDSRCPPSPSAPASAP